MLLIYLYDSLVCLTYLTVSSTFPSNRMVHEIFDEPPRPNIKTLDGERNIPLDATLDLLFWFGIRMEMCVL